MSQSLLEQVDAQIAEAEAKVAGLTAMLRKLRDVRATVADLEGLAVAAPRRRAVARRPTARGSHAPAPTRRASRSTKAAADAHGRPATRDRILAALAGGAAGTQELATAVGVGQAAVLYHLHALVANGQVVSQGPQNARRYRLARTPAALSPELGAQSPQPATLKGGRVPRAAAKVVRPAAAEKPASTAPTGPADAGPRPDQAIRAAVVGKFASGASYTAAELLRAARAVDSGATTEAIETLAGELVTAGKVERLWGNTPARWRKRGTWK